MSAPSRCAFRAMSRGRSSRRSCGSVNGVCPGVDELVLSLSAKGLTHGEIAAHLAEVYGTEVSKQTISTITDKVMDGMSEWQNRPLDPGYPVIFVDAIVCREALLNRVEVGDLHLVAVAAAA